MTASEYVVAHESRHVAMALTLGIDPSRVQVQPNGAGQVDIPWPENEREWPRFALIALAGRLGDKGWPPAVPSKLAETQDERQTATIVERLGLDWTELVHEAERLAATPKYRRYEQRVGDWLHRCGTLSESALASIKAAATRRTTWMTPSATRTAASRTRR